MSRSFPQFVLERRPPPSFSMTLATYIGSVVAALAFASVLVIQTGVDPIYAYYELFRGALGDKLSVTETLVRFTPLLLTGTAVALAFRCKFWNIGAEGQLFAGGIASAYFGFSFIGSPSWLVIPLMVVGGFLAGAAWAVWPAILRVRLKADEVVTTLLGNWVIYFFAAYLLNGPWRDPVTSWPETPAITASARFPVLISGSRLHLGLIIALAFAAAYFFIVRKTSWGFELKAVGSNPRASVAMGISATRVLVTAAILSGGIAGLAGVSEVGGIHFHMKMDVSPGFGYTGIVIAMLGALHPIGVMIAAFLMAVIVQGAQAMHRVTGVPWPLSEVIQGSILILLLIGTFLMTYRIRRVKTWRKNY